MSKLILPPGYVQQVEDGVRKPSLVVPGMPRQHGAPLRAAPRGRPVILNCRACGASAFFQQEGPLPPGLLEKTRCGNCGHLGVRVAGYGGVARGA